MKAMAVRGMVHGDGPEVWTSGMHLAPGMPYGLWSQGVFHGDAMHWDGRPRGLALGWLCMGCAQPNCLLILFFYV